ncbi:MAG: alpha/beta hydrolase [Pseudomonadota bacterium]
MRIIKNLLLLVILLMLTVWAIALVNVHLTSHQYTQLTPAQKQQAKQYLQGKLTPIPEEWQWDTFYPQPNVNLRTGVIHADDAKGLVIVVPGFTGTIEMMMREIEQIHASGFTTASIEYRGQGASWRPLAHPEKGHVEDYRELGADLAKFAESVRLPGKPLFFFSVSKGAHITMRMAAEQNVDVDAFALIVPMIKINSGDLDYGSLESIANMLYAVGLGSMYAPGQKQWPGGEFVLGEATDCNANAELAQSQSALFAEREELRTSGTTVRWLKETVASTKILLDPEQVKMITSPVKVFTAGIDTLVDTGAARQFCDSLANCEEVHLANSRHCITRESFEVYDGMIQDSIEHFEANL